MRKLIGLALVLCLSACGSLGSIQNPITQNRLATIESTYGVLLSVAVGYRNACAEKRLPRSCRPIVAQLQSAGRVAHNRVLELRAFVRDNPTLDATVLITSAQSAVAAFQDVQTVYGVKAPGS